MASRGVSPKPSEEYLAESIGGRLESTAIAFIIIQTVCIIFRTISRSLQRTHFMWQDAFATLSYVFNMALCILLIVEVQHAAAGRHVQAVSASELVLFFKLFYIVNPVIYSVCFSLPKLAILDIYLHIFIDRTTRIICYITGATFTLSTIVNIPTTVWQCSPVSYVWEAPVNPNAQGSCNNIRIHYLYASLPSIVTDVVMLLLPLPTIWRLHTSLKMKLGLLATFTAGGIGLVTSILRFVGFTRSYADPTWAAVDIAIWLAVEPGIYLVAACFMTYNHLIRYVVFQSPLSSIFTKASSDSRQSESASHHKRSGTSTHKGTPSFAKPGSELYPDTSTLISGQKGSHDTFDLVEQRPVSSLVVDEHNHGIRVKHEFAVDSSLA